MLRQEPSRNRRFYFFALMIRTVALCSTHNLVVSLTLVRLHARLLCASPPASLTDESLMIHHKQMRKLAAFFLLFPLKDENTCAKIFSRIFYVRRRHKRMLVRKQWKLDNTHSTISADKRCLNTLWARTGQWST